jgi:predicted nucleotidyltransferase component of viral defense system
VSPDKPKNMAASVHQRLKNAAAGSGQTFNDLLQHYALERFLYRLSVSPHASAFILKGALLLRVWGVSAIRPTRDIDLLGRTTNDPESIARIMREVCEMAVDDDGLTFDASTVRAERIADDAEYEGIRTLFDGRLGNARIRMQIDVGFGDRITPAPEAIEYPTVLGMARPRLRAYPPETSIAEKLHVMLQRGMLNSRMKDYFDIWSLSRSRSFDGRTLAEAITATCSRRNTPVDPEPVALSDRALVDPQNAAQWMAFVRRLPGTDAPPTFEAVGAAVAAFLVPLLRALAEQRTFDQVWSPPGPWHERD